MIVAMYSSVTLVLLLGTLAATANLLGGVLPLLRPRASERYLVYGLAFSGGFLLAVTLLHIAPECIRRTPDAPLLIVAGYFLVYVTEHVFAGHAHHETHKPHGAHPLIGTHQCKESGSRIRLGAAWSAAVGLAVHSFFDGATIAAAVSTKSTVGWLTFLAVILHKIPEGFSLSAIVLSSTGSKRKAFMAACVLGGACITGALATVLAATVIADVEIIVLSVAAGMFLHIAATDLLPTTAQVRGLKVMTATIGGALSVVVLSTIFRTAF